MQLIDRIETNSFQGQRFFRLTTCLFRYKMMLGSKDAIRIVSYSHNSTQYSHIVKLTLHFYAHIGAGH